MQKGKFKRTSFFFEHHGTNDKRKSCGKDQKTQSSPRFVINMRKNTRLVPWEVHFLDLPPISVKQLAILCRKFRVSGAIGLSLSTLCRVIANA